MGRLPELAPATAPQGQEGRATGQRGPGHSCPRSVKGPLGSCLVPAEAGGARRPLGLLLPDRSAPPPTLKTRDAPRVTGTARHASSGGGAGITERPADAPGARTHLRRPRFYPSGGYAAPTECAPRGTVPSPPPTGPHLPLLSQHRAHGPARPPLTGCRWWKSPPGHTCFHEALDRACFAPYEGLSLCILARSASHLTNRPAGPGRGRDSQPSCCRWKPQALPGLWQLPATPAGFRESPRGRGGGRGWGEAGGGQQGPGLGAGGSVWPRLSWRQLPASTLGHCFMATFSFTRILLGWGAACS